MPAGRRSATLSFMRLFGVLALLIVAGLAASCALIVLQNGDSTFGVIGAALPGLRLEFGLRVLAAPFLALLAMLSVAVGLWALRRGSAADAVRVAIFAAAMLLVLVSQSVAAFFLAWETMSLASAFLVATHHQQRSVRRATVTYVVIAQIGALCMLSALILLAVHAGSASFAAIAAKAESLPGDVRDIAFALALIGFGSKAGLLPLHFWLPKAHPVAPSHASAMLSGVMLKVALYGLALFGLQLAAPAHVSWGIALLAIGAISAVAGVLYAIVDHDLKRLLAYHSVENIGIIVIGLGVAVLMVALGNPSLASLALVAALFHSINHGLFKGLLFLGAGTVADEEGTVDLERLGGLWPVLTWTASFFLVGCAAISALPPFNGFVSEWLTFRALIAGFIGTSFAIKLVLLGAVSSLALASGLAAACFAKVFGVAFLGRPRRALRRTEPERFDVSVAGLGLLALLCVVFGLVPWLALAPLARVARAVVAAPPLAVPSAPTLPAIVIAIPVMAALGAYVVARVRGVRRIETWTCGSLVTPSAQYSATAFSKPVRTIFAIVLAPMRRRTVEAGTSAWFPQRIVYQTESRYLIDETVRRLSALLLAFARRSRHVQSGSLRLYLIYAVLAVMLAVAAVR